MAEGKDSSESGSGTRSSRAGCARSGLLGLAAILIVVYLFTRAGDGNGEDDVDHSATLTTEPRVTTTLADRPGAVEPVCPDEDGESRHTLMFTEAPPMCIDVDATYVATVETNRGDFEITLDPEGAPEAVNSFVFLARWGFYDGVGFNRVLRDYLAQAGDPFDPNIGDADAGYVLPEEPPAERPYYPVGSVSMASLYPEPDSTGSEFFVATGPEAERLLPLGYSRIGRVTDGMNVVDAINATANPNDDIGVPNDPTVIATVTVEEQ